MQVKRGDIYYVGGGYATGSEQRAGRPAIVVSNDKNNEHSSTVEMVYLTTKPKRDMPTHVSIRSLSQDSIAICEQVTTVAVERVGEYCGRLTAAEMTALEKAIMISLGINRSSYPGDATQRISELTAKVSEAETRYAMLQQVYDSLLSRVVRQ